MKALFILADLGSGGAQKVVLNVLRHLSRELFEPHLGIINSDGPLYREIPKDVLVHDLNAKKVRYAFPSICMLCRSLKPDVIFTTLSHLNLSLIGLKFFLHKRTRIIIREANIPSIRLKHTKRPRIYHNLYRILYPHADRIVCNSIYMQKDLINRFLVPQEKTCVIRNPVDVDNIRVESSRNPYQKGVLNLVSVGRLDYQKGYDLLIEAFAYAFKENNGLRLTIVGDGPDRESLQKLIESYEIEDSLILAGHKANPYPYMAHADLFISSSRWEGSPNVVLESLACGTPVLAFDCPGGTGEILTEGKNGWIVPLPHVHEMSLKILDLAKNKKSLNTNSKSFLPDEFKFSNVIQAYEHLFLEFNIT